MELAGKILGFLASVLALGLVLLFAWTARSWATAQIVKTLRDELKYVRDELEESDNEVRSLRLKEKEHEEKIALLEARYRAMDDDARAQRLYGFNRDREAEALDRKAKLREQYILRLEALCLDKGHSLPSRDDD